MDEEIPASAQNATKIAIISALFIVLLAVISISWFLFRPQQSKPSPVVTPSPTSGQTLSTPPSTPQFIEPSTVIKTYTSPELGLRFKYNPKFEPTIESVDTLRIEETGNTVHIVPSSLPSDQGQFVRVFEKTTNESLEEAIRRLFLAGKDTSRCLVTIAETSSQYTAEITFPQDPDGSMSSFFENSAYCSNEYAQTNGIRYFLQNKAIPNKFIFISIGQYPIYADEGIPWQNTIEILN